MSVPAAKARPPAPRITSTLTSPPGSARSQISASPSYMAKVSELRLSGRLKVTQPMSSVTS